MSEPSEESLAFVRSLYGPGGHFIEEDDFAHRIDAHVAERTAAEAADRAYYQEALAARRQKYEALRAKADAMAEALSGILAGNNDVDNYLNITTIVVPNDNCVGPARRRLVAYRALSPTGDGSTASGRE